jgi:putative peptidoglycan lipid II flippase
MHSSAPKHAAVPDTQATQEKSPAPIEEDADSPTLDENVSSSAALISICVFISRVTGFFRTWAMAFALGSTFLASSYQVANNLPNSLYELVVGGMLVTAFLPVYVSVKKKLGQEGANRYASNLLSMVILFLGITAVLCIIFAAQLIYTQSFMSDQSQMSTSVFFFRFFAIQILFYGVGAIVSGLLNASRDYLWSSIAPAFNNIVVIVTFLAYAFIAPSNPELALYIIAIGNPAGVFLQMAMQLPALKRNGITLHWHLDWHDPYLRETLQIGIPAVIVMATSFAITSVQTAVAYHIADNGPSIISYARLWFTLPYAFLAVPITTSMFTELAEMRADGDAEGFKAGVINGSRQIVFMTIPFALYLMVFSAPLVTLYTMGAFTTSAVREVADYLIFLALALPFYSVNTYLQKIFSSLREMKRFAAINLICATIQIACTVIFGAYLFGDSVTWGMAAVALSEGLFFLISDIICFGYLRKRFGHLGLKRLFVEMARGLVLGLLGAAAGGLIAYMVLPLAIGSFQGSLVISLVTVIIAGLVSLIVTFGIALKLDLPGAESIRVLMRKITGRLHRG